MNDETRQNSPPGQQAPDLPVSLDYYTGLVSVVREPPQPFSEWLSMSPEQRQQLYALLNEMSSQLSKEPEVSATVGSFIDRLRQEAKAVGERLKMTAE